jgi:rRNA maturation endonuclease Nob1
MKIKQQYRCIACNKVVSKKNPYCFTCLNELKEKAGEEE